MAVDTVIDLADIVKSYKVKKQHEPFLALDGVSLSVERGELFGLLGSNGAGKTTLIKIMAGLLEPNGGTGTVLGHDIYRDHKAIRSCVSLVAPTADVGTDNNLTVRQNLEFWAVVYDLDRSQRAARIDEMLDFLDLRPYENAWPMSISAGNRQKVAIARSLLVRNPILFLDEPTVKLDETAAASVRELIARINAEFATTVILTTHFLFEAEELCGRVAIMDHGKIVSCDTIEHLRDRWSDHTEMTVTCDRPDDTTWAALDALPFVVSSAPTDHGLSVRLREDDRLTDVLGLLRGDGLSIQSVATRTPTLEDIFVDTINGGRPALNGEGGA